MDTIYLVIEKIETYTGTFLAFSSKGNAERFMEKMNNALNKASHRSYILKEVTVVTLPDIGK